jgi:hypothetical protein
MVTLSLTTLSACGNDDDNTDQTSSELVGIWVDNDELEAGDEECCGFRFDSDGSGSEGTWNTANKRFKSDGDMFSWSVKSGRIIIDYGDDLWISNYMIKAMLYMWNDGEPVG